MALGGVEVGGLTDKCRYRERQSGGRKRQPWVSVCVWGIRRPGRQTNVEIETVAEREAGERDRDRDRETDRQHVHTHEAEAVGAPPLVGWTRHTTEGESRRLGRSLFMSSKMESNQEY